MQPCRRRLRLIGVTRNGEECLADPSTSSASGPSTLALPKPPPKKEAIQKAAERFEIPPERRNRITVQKAGRIRISGDRCKSSRPVS